MVIDRAERVERGVPTPRHHHGTHREQDLDSVLRQGRDATADRHSLGLERLDVAADLVADLVRGEHRTVDVYGGALAVSLQRRDEQIGQEHGAMQV